MGNHKDFLSLDEQILKLEAKQVEIEDATAVKQVLLDSNYYNLISCSKAKFAKSRGENGKYTYRPSKFDQWQQYFEQDCQVSEHLMKNILRFERMLNSRTAYYIAELIEQKSLDENKLQSLIDLINSKDSKNQYSGDRTWQFIAKKTFGELKKVIRWLWNNSQRETVRKIVHGFDFLKANTLQRLDELVNLRNTIFHFTTLTIYLVYGSANSGSVYKVRKFVIESVFYQSTDTLTKQQMTEIFRVSQQFIKMKMA